MAENVELLYATNNPGKLEEVRTFLGAATPLRSPKDLSLDIEVDESGDTLEVNSRLKAEGFRAKAPEGVIVMADDTGFEIDALGGEPGVYVRRWRDHRTEMTDEEIIEYCLERMRDVPKGKRGAQFRTVITLALPSDELKQFDGVLRGELAEKPLDSRTPGLPFRALLYMPETGKFLDDLENQHDPELLTHRQAAVQKAVDWLRDYNK
ncbi:MAG: non-canonical purine NTP pyrophosphatase [bacterium]|nr:non-canonical purine NTP pyrophosphatase [bacterium]